MRCAQWHNQLTMQEIENPPTQKAAKPVKRNFAWTEQKELTLANYVFKGKGYMRTDTNFTDKFTTVSIKISSDQGRYSYYTSRLYCSVNDT